MLSRETADGLDLDTVTNQRGYHKRPEKTPYVIIEAPIPKIKRHNEKSD